MGIGISVGVKGIARAYTQRHTHRDTDTHIQFALNKPNTSSSLAGNGKKNFDIGLEISGKALLSAVSCFLS